MFQNQLTVNIADRDELQKKLRNYKGQVSYVWISIVCLSY